MGYISLALYYENLFNMVQMHNQSISDVNDLLPYERDILVEMILGRIQKQQEMSM